MRAHVQRSVCQLRVLIPLVRRVNMRIVMREPCNVCRNSCVRAQPANETSELNSALAGSVDPAYQEGYTFLRSLGFDNPAEMARILDIAMNPNSIFARRLSVKDDMIPVVDYLSSRGLSQAQVVSVIREHPPTLSYSISDRLQPLFEYLEGIGVQEVPEVIAKRPSLLGLNADNVQSIVDYLQANNYTPEQISEYLANTI